MQVSQPNDVKIYNLSAGKSLPEVKAETFYSVSLLSSNERLALISQLSTWDYLQGDIALL